jgi:hypothetical protein
MSAVTEDFEEHSIVTQDEAVLQVSEFIVNQDDPEDASAED